MIIYLFTNKVNGKKYVGQTTRPFEHRFSEHRRKDSLLSRAFKKYGIENFEHEILDTASDMDELNEKEIFWIKRLNTKRPNGYNLCDGGDNTKGYRHTEEAKQKMSATKKRLGSMKGEKNHFYGKKHSEETKAHLKSLWTSGKRTITPEWRAKLIASQRTVKVRNVDTGEVFKSVKAAAEKYNVNPSNVSRACREKTRRAGGQRWEYPDDKTIPSQATEK